MNRLSSRTICSPSGERSFRKNARVCGDHWSQATGWVIASNGGVDLKNSQAHTDQCPVRFRGSDPLLWLAGSVGMMEDAPPCANLFVVSPLKPDYLLVWGMSDEALATPCGAALSAGLEGEFVRVFRSSPRGMLEIWRPRARTATASR